MTPESRFSGLVLDHQVLEELASFGNRLKSTLHLILSEIDASYGHLGKKNEMPV